MGEMTEVLSYILNWWNLGYDKILVRGNRGKVRAVARGWGQKGLLPSFVFSL